ncbi:MAG: hypothetical protein Q8908_11340 [Bacteroidota bacterium]|nr:hypothetical protein [Bacteroidota bacterium]
MKNNRNSNSGNEDVGAVVNENSTPDELDAQRKEQDENEQIIMLEEDLAITYSNKLMACPEWGI